MTDPLSRLVADETEVNRELLAKALENKVRIDPKAGAVTFKPGVRDQIGAKGTVITILLARKALSLLSGEFSEGLAPRDLEELVGIRGNTLRPILKRLTDAGLVVRRGGHYLIPNYALDDVANEIRKEAQ